MKRDLQKQINVLWCDIAAFEMRIKDAPKEKRSSLKVWLRKKKNQLKELQNELNKGKWRLEKSK